MVRRIVESVLVSLVLLAVPLSVQGGAFFGTVKSVSPEQGSLVVELAKDGSEKSFKLSSTTRISLNKKSVSLSSVESGQRVSVYTSSSTGAVTRVIVSKRSTTSDSKPKTPEPATPEPTEAKSTPDASPAAKSKRSSRRSRDNTDEAASWSQFRGPNRDNVSEETGLMTIWPKTGPKGQWATPGLGEGFWSVSVANDMVYTMGNLGSDEKILAMELRTGKPLWATTNGPKSEAQTKGPRSTPTVDGDRVYALGAGGDLSCVDAATGQVHWQKNIIKAFEGDVPGWGISESVLIDGDKLICTPGVARANMVALDKMTGDLIWKASVPGAPSGAFASAIVTEAAGVRQYVNYTSRGIVGIRADDGKFLWQDSATANATANWATAIGFDNFIFSSSAYGAGGALLELSASDEGVEARRVYITKNLKSEHGGMVVLDGHIYGTTETGVLICLKLDDGNVMWEDPSVGKGLLTYADGHFYLRSEDGPVAFIEATPDEYREKGRLLQPRRSDKKAWVYPVVSNGKLFLRDQDILFCYNIKGR